MRRALTTTALTAALALAGAAAQEAGEEGGARPLAVPIEAALGEDASAPTLRPRTLRPALLPQGRHPAFGPVPPRPWAEGAARLAPEALDAPDGPLSVEFTGARATLTYAFGP